MVGMAGNTFQGCKTLMKQDILTGSFFIFYHRVLSANVSQLVTGNTFIVGNSLEWVMAGKAFVTQLLMSFHEFTRVEHFTGIQVHEHQAGTGYGKNNCRFHLLNIRTATMCINDRSPNTMVMGR